jgi:hypothetical protein
MILFFFLPESRNIHIPSGAIDLFPLKTSTVFKTWESISWSQYASYDFTRDPIRAGIVSAKHLFYKATLERGRGTLKYYRKSTD